MTSKSTTNYRDEEMAPMYRQLQENPLKIPSPSRDEMIRMLNGTN